MKINLAGLVAAITGGMRFPTGEVGDLAATAQQIKDFVLPPISTTIAAAALRGCGTVPVVIIVAPGASKFHAIHRVLASFKTGATAFDFTGDLILKSVGGDTQYIISGDLNVLANANFDLVKTGQHQATNVNYILTTSDGLNATVGDGDLDLRLNYSIEDINT